MGNAIFSDNLQKDFKDEFLDKYLDVVILTIKSITETIGDKKPSEIYDAIRSIPNFGDKAMQGQFSTYLSDIKKYNGE